MDNLTYRTDDNTRWGSGQGSNLAAVTIDLNFWDLFSSVTALEDHQQTLSEIDFLNVVGNQMFVHMTDHRVLGPYTLPSAQWNPRGAWAPLTNYAAFDVVSNNGSVYLVTANVTSASTFSAFATDGQGHNLYMLLLAEPDNMLPTGGNIANKLVKSSGSPFATEWVPDLVRLVYAIEGQPQPDELLPIFVCVDHMFLPAGLTGSIAYSNTPTQTNVSFTISKNGAAIGSINFFGPSPEEITPTFPSQVNFVPGDIITINAPAVPDAIQSDISMVFVATLT